nr:MAG TPA: hypothetical protein [Bacteriophage sp.]
MPAICRHPSAFDYVEHRKSSIIFSLIQVICEEK